MRNFKEYGITRHLIQTSWYGNNAGLREKHVKRAIRILRGETS